MESILIKESHYKDFKVMESNRKTHGLIDRTTHHRNFCLRGPTVESNHTVTHKINLYSPTNRSTKTGPYLWINYIMEGGTNGTLHSSFSFSFVKKMNLTNHNFYLDYPN